MAGETWRAPEPGEKSVAARALGHSGSCAGWFEETHWLGKCLWERATVPTSSQPHFVPRTAGASAEREVRDDEKQSCAAGPSGMVGLQARSAHRSISALQRNPGLGQAHPAKPRQTTLDKPSFPHRHGRVAQARCVSVPLGVRNQTKLNSKTTALTLERFARSGILSVCECMCVQRRHQPSLGCLLARLDLCAGLMICLNCPVEIE